MTQACDLKVQVLKYSTQQQNSMENNPFPFALKLNSDLLILLSKSEHDRLQGLYQQSFARMDAIAFTPRKREEVQRLSGQDDETCDVNAFSDSAVGRHVTEIIDLLQTAGWRHVSGDNSVLTGEVLDHIFTELSAQGKSYYPIIASASCDCYRHHDFQRLFLDTCRKRRPYDVLARKRSCAICIKPDSCSSSLLISALLNKI